MNRVVHFEIHAGDPARAAKFYGDVFGWKIVKWAGPMDYWLVTTGPDGEPGINGAIVARRGAIDGTAVIAFVCTIEVADIDAIIAKAEAAGATVALPKGPVPGIGWLAYYKDPDGNIFGIIQNDPPTPRPAPAT